MGEDFGGPQKIEVGTTYAFVPPQYFERFGYWMWDKPRADLKRCQGGIVSCEIEVFGQEKGYAWCYKSEFQTVETDKIESMTKKWLSEILGGKWPFFFFKKVIRKFGTFTPNSAPSLRPSPLEYYLCISKELPNNC